MRLKVEGVCLFFAEDKAASPLVSKEKEKLVPIFPLVAPPASSAWKCWSYGIGGTAPLTLGRAGEYIKSPLINTDVYQLQLFVVLANPIYL